MHPVPGMKKPRSENKGKANPVPQTPETAEIRLHITDIRDQNKPRDARGKERAGNRTTD